MIAQPLFDLFQKQATKAIMLIRKEGIARTGTYTRDDSQTKKIVDRVWKLDDRL